MPNEDCVVAYDSVVHETEKAYLFAIDGEEHWIAKSQCEIYDESSVILPEWLVDRLDIWEYVTD